MDRKFNLFKLYSLIILVEMPDTGLMSCFKFGDQAKKFILTLIAKKLKSRGVYNLGNIIIKTLIKTYFNKIFDI